MKAFVKDKSKMLEYKPSCLCELSFLMSRYVLKRYMHEVWGLMTYYKEYKESALDFNVGSFEYYIWETVKFDLGRFVNSHGRFVYLKMSESVKKTFRKKLAYIMHGRKKYEHTCLR